MDLTAGMWLGPHSLHLVVVGSEGDHAAFTAPSHPRVDTSVGITVLLDALHELAGDEVRDIAVALPASTDHANRVAVLRSFGVNFQGNVHLVATPIAATMAANPVGELATLEIERGAVTLGWTSATASHYDLRGLMSWRDAAWRPEVQSTDAVYQQYLSEAPLIIPALLSEMSATFLNEGEELPFWNIVAMGDLGRDSQLMAAFGRNIEVGVVSIGPEGLARGAARFARTRSGLNVEVKSASVLDSVVGIDGPDAETFIEVLDWFDPLPSMRSVPITTAVDDQASILVSVYEGPTNAVDHASLVGVFGIEGIPSGPAGSVSIEMMIDVDDNGLIGVSAFDVHTQQDLEVSIAAPPQSLPYCVDCGAVSGREAMFCENCGQRIDQDPPVSVIDAQFAALQALSSPTESVANPHSAQPHTVTCLPCGSDADLLLDACGACGFPPSYLVEPLSPLVFVGARVSRTAVLESLGRTEGSLTSRLEFDREPTVSAGAETKECPFCAEIIKAAARKCRHCGEFLEPLEAVATVQQVAPSAQAAPSATIASLFISHASHDGEVAQEVARALDESGFATWLATRDIEVGENYASQIYEAITDCSHLLVLLSPASVQSQHVKREANIAIDLGKPLLPLVVAHDADFMKVLPSEWKYWLGVVQAAPYTDPAAAVKTVRRSIGVAEDG